MASAAEHYDRHLGTIYEWMWGSDAAAFRRARAELEEAVGPGRSGLAVDLGAGFGLHAVPLAELGFQVLAVERCEPLIQRLAEHMRGRPVRIAACDLRDFRAQLNGPAQLVLCMGDTLTHLESLQDVERLLREVHAALRAGGRFLAGFRDYRVALTGEARFIPVKCSPDRLLTCFVEYRDDTVLVHDILHERRDGAWTMQVSSYPKLRLDPDWLSDRLAASGFTTAATRSPAGLIRITAIKAA